MIKPTLFGLWAINKHADTNHYYDINLPYDYHLSLSVKSGENFKHLLLPGDWEWVQDVLWGHDLMEDARVSYNDIVREAKKYHSIENAIKIAEAIRALTNYNRGRNRKERMPDYIYQEIKSTPGATFAKVAGDRIANVNHGLIFGSSMKKKYKEEQEHFKKMLYTNEYKEIWDYLDNLLKLNL